MRKPLCLTGVAIGLLSIHALAIQPLMYRNPPGRLLRYREHTVSTTKPDASSLSTLTHSAVIVVRFGRSNAAEAWYESLALTVESKHIGIKVVDTSAVLRLPFRFVLDPGGTVSALRTPSFPKDVGSVTDLTHQFDDFFIRLPVHRNPTQGWSVSYSVPEHPSPRVPQLTFTAAYMPQPRMGSSATLSFAEKAAMSIVFTGSQPGNPSITARVESSGPSEGSAEFDLATGTLLSRVRKGELSTTVTYSGVTPPPPTPAGSYSYTSELRLLPGA